VYEWGQEGQGTDVAELGKDTKNNKKGFHRYVSQKMKDKESITSR